MPHRQKSASKAVLQAEVKPQHQRSLENAGQAVPRRAAHKAAAHKAKLQKSKARSKVLAGQGAGLPAWAAGTVVS